MTKKEVREAMKETRGYLRVLERDLRDGDWNAVETWAGSIEGMWGMIRDELERREE
jgi:hypothetical protein